MRNKLRKNHKLSFVIPTYNAADYIQSTINSIVQSKISNCEIICVDDCSVDGTNELLEALSKKHEQLITFKLGKNQGQSFCRNFGLSKASGEYIFFFDADDTLIEAEKSLHWLLHLIDKTPGPIDLIQINNTIEEQVLLHPKSSKTIPVGQTNSALQFDNIDKFLYIQNKKQTVGFQAWRFLYRRTFLWDTGIKFNPKMRIWEDALFTFKCLQSASSIICTDLQIYKWRLDRSESLSNKHGTHYQDYFKLMSSLIEAGEKEISREKRLFNAKLIHSSLFELNLICSQIDWSHMPSDSYDTATLKKVSAVLKQFNINQFVHITGRSQTFKQLIERLTVSRDRIITNILTNIKPKKKLFVIPASRQNAYLLGELRTKYAETECLLDGNVALTDTIIHKEKIKYSTEHFSKNQNDSFYVINFSTKASQLKYDRYLREKIGLRDGENFLLLPDELNGRE